MKEVEGKADLDVLGHFVRDERVTFETYGYTTIGWTVWGYATAATKGRVTPVGPPLPGKAWRRA